MKNYDWIGIIDRPTEREEADIYMAFSKAKIGFFKRATFQKPDQVYLSS